MILGVVPGDAPLQLLHPLRYWGYQFWSGIGSDLGEITLITGALALYKHHQCDKPWCLLPGHPHPHHGRPVCRLHYHDDDIAP